MRIAFITGLHAWGGSEELWAAAADAALKDGHEVRLWLHHGFDGPRVNTLVEQGASIRRRRWFAPGRLGKIASKFTRSFSDLQAFRPDVVCFSQPNTYAVVEQADLARAVAILQEMGTPYVLVCQWNSSAIGLGEAQRQAALAAFRAAHRLAFVAERNLLTARRQLASDLPNALVVQNPVNLQERSIVPWPPSDSPASFACVARLVADVKGQDVLFETLSASEWKHRDWQLQLYGKGGDEAHLRRLAEYFGLSSRVVFRGHVSDVRQIWNENHLLVLPSRSEGTPLALVEAMVCGRPAVVTNVGGNAAQIRAGVDGFVASAPTVNAIATAMEQAWTARSGWQRMGRAAHDVAIVRLDRDPGRSLLNLLAAPILKNASRVQAQSEGTASPTLQEAGAADAKATARGAS